MMTIFFSLLMFAVFGKLLVFAVKCVWSITKVVFVFAMLPIILIGLFIAGVTYIAVPVLVVLGIITLVKSITDRSTMMC